MIVQATLPTNLKASGMRANLVIFDHPCGLGWVDSSSCISEPTKKKDFMSNNCRPGKTNAEGFDEQVAGFSECKCTCFWLAQWTS